MPTDLKTSAPHETLGSEGGLYAENDTLAKSLGFASYLELFEASTPVASADGRHWFATPVDRGAWIAWNHEELNPSRRLASKEDTVRLIQSGFTPSSPATCEGGSNRCI